MFYQLPICNLFTQHVIYLLWRDTTSELWAPVLFSTLIKQPQAILFTYCNYCSANISFHSIRSKITGNRRPWIADDLNKGELYKFYWLLAGVCLANLVVYLFAARWYKYKAGRPGADGSVNGVEMADAEPCLH